MTLNTFCFLSGSNT